MMKLKRFGSVVLATTFIGGTLAMTACGNKNKTVNDGKTVNVQVFKKGYGDEWAYELKKNFEKAYESQGYKMNILTPSGDMKGEVALSDMALGAKTTGVDLYIVGNVNPEAVGVKGEYGILAEDIRETVYNKKAINYQGQEEEKTVAEKLTPGAEKWLVDQAGTMYAFNWAASAYGMVVNTRKLAAYGLQIPVTTNQMFDCFEKIYMGHNGIENSEKSGTYPVTYFGGAGYVSGGYAAWQMQYDLDAYDQFWSMQKEVNGQKVDMVDDGYEVFKSDAIQSALEITYRYLDPKLPTYGATTQTLDQGQAAIMKDRNGAVFMLNGDWFLNEVKLNYKSKLNDITFIRTPINSDLGVRLFGAGSSYNLDETKADELLALISTLSDENKDIAEIISTVKTQLNVTLSEEDALEVATARNAYISGGLDHRAYITKDANAKELAELVLRMMASDDFAQTFSQYANTNSPYTRTENTTSQYKFVKDASKITLNKYAKLYVDTTWSGLRKQLALAQDLPLSGMNLCSDIQKDAITMFDGKGNKLAGATKEIYVQAATNLMMSNYNYAKDNWANWINDRLS